MWLSVSQKAHKTACLFLRQGKNGSHWFDFSTQASAVVTVSESAKDKVGCTDPLQIPYMVLAMLISGADQTKSIFVAHRACL